MGYDVIERRITRDEFYIADEAFFTGTAAEVTPIREYDDRQIGEGVRGPITTQIQKAYFDAVQGKDPEICTLVNVCEVIKNLLIENLSFERFLTDVLILPNLCHHIHHQEDFKMSFRYTQ